MRTKTGFFDYDGDQKVVVCEWHEDGPNKNCRLVLELVNTAISRLYMENINQPGVVLSLEKTNIRVKDQDEAPLSTCEGQFFFSFNGFYEVFCEDKCIFKLTRKAVQHYECFA